MIMRFVMFAFLVAFVCAAATPSLARGTSSSKALQNSDLTVSKTNDKSSPKMLDAKPVQQNRRRFDPYKNYKFCEKRIGQQ